ncbi:MAG: FecR domain-containing protein [Bacteroidia bacterium]|nr:FecR domain-containing protein [Bacteroidia bacterium]
MTTSKNPGYKSYIELLQDKTFVQWRIAPSEEVANYWENIIENNPQLKIETLKADNYLKKHFSEENQLTDKNKAELFNSIADFISKKQKSRPALIKLLPYVIAACIVVFVAGGLFLHQLYKKQNTPLTTLVEGNTQTPEDIRLITGNTISTFKQDIEIKVENGIAFIDEGSQNEKKIEIEDATTVNKLIVPYGKRSKIQLPDGSIVWLNSGTTLEFPSEFAGEKREIHLQGEIYIEVATDKDSPLYVHTPRFSVEALGTAFNVSAYNPLELAAVLVEGRINVHSNNNKKEVLPNEIAIIDEMGNISTKQTQTESYTSWKNGYLLFEDTPIAMVLTQIERYYNLKFRYAQNSSLQNITCTGKLYLSDNIDHIMRSMSLLTNTTYTRKGNAIILTNEQ